MKGYVKTEGGYKPGSFYMKDSTCKVLTLLLGDTFESMLNAAGAMDGCPLPPVSSKHSSTLRIFVRISYQRF